MNLPSALFSLKTFDNTGFLFNSSRINFLILLFLSSGGSLSEANSASTDPTIQLSSQPILFTF